MRACEIDWTAVATFALCVVTGGLWWATMRLVREAQMTSTRQLRGYLSVSPRGLVATLAQPASIDKQSVRMQVRLKNHGHTPVTQIRYRYGLDVFQHPLPADFEFPLATHGDEVNLSLPPGEHTNSNLIRSKPLSAQELSDIGKDTARIYAWGEATYLDVFNAIRRVEFAVSVVGGAFFAKYFTQFCASAGSGMMPKLPPGMEHPFDFDTLDRHGHGD